MVEVSANAYMPFVGRTEQTSGLSPLAKNVPDIPLPNHGFQKFIDRLFRFTELMNWILAKPWAVGRTAISEPVEQKIVEVVLCSGVVAINC